jgi:hypothetical protein
MNNKAQTIWSAFCGELIDNGLKDGEDVRQALSTAIREAVFELQYYNFERGEDLVVSSRALYELCDDLEAL